MRFDLVCRRPAVSAITSSMPRAAARSTPSKITELGSPPSAPRTISAPDRSAQVVSCSAAAARNVSPAARSTVRPSRICWLASLPIVVVFPTPLTPTNIQTFGPPASGSNASVRSDPARRETISASSSSTSPCGSVISFEATLARRPSSRSVVTPTPTSARSSASSRSSKLSSVIPLRPSTPTTAPLNASRAFASRSRNDAGLTGSTTSGSASTTSTAVSGRSSTAVAAPPPVSLGGGVVGAAVRVDGADGPAALRRLTTTTAMPNATTAIARIRNRISIPIDGDATWPQGDGLTRALDPPDVPPAVRAPSEFRPTTRWPTPAR